MGIAKHDQTSSARESDFSQLVKDYSRERVPTEKLVSGYRIALVIIGCSITVPLMITGASLGNSIGLAQSLPAFFAGGAVLMLIGICTASVGTLSGVSTYMIVKVSFGAKGAVLINLLMAVTLLGWYGVTAALFGQAVSQSLLDYAGLSLDPSMATLIGSLLVVAVTIFGFKALERLSLWMVPLMVLFLAVLLFKVWGYPQVAPGDVTSQDTLSLQQAISVTVGGYIVGATLIPDLSRYALSLTHSVVAVVVSLGIGLPLVLVIPALAGDAVGHSDLVKILVGLGLGLPAVMMIVLATWSTNMTNLYSSSLAVAAVLDKVDKWKITLVVGVCCTLMATSDMTDFFINFLLLLGVLIPPIAGIYVVDFFVVNRKAYEEGQFDANTGVGKIAMLSWLLGALMGWLASLQTLTLTGVASCDSIITSVSFYWLLKRVEQRFMDQQLGAVSDDSV